ncbi:MAG: recombinase family protein [Desulfobacterales bacterium]|nr:recombinase family protein [Desulfobacterales bacterium]
MQVGYVRVSTHEQNLNLQIDDLKKAGCEKIFQDKVSGVASARPGIKEAVSFLREGDTLVVWRLDRLGRSLKHLIELVGQFEEQKIGFKSLKESIDTTNASGKLFFHIFAALAEFERDLISERTMAGLAAARARGKSGGRPSKHDEKDKKMIVELYNSRKHSIKEICDTFGISKTTLYNYLRTLNAEAE